MRAHHLDGGLRDRRAQRWIGQKRGAALRHQIHVSGRTRESSDAVLDDLGKAAHVRRDHRDFARHRLERREAEAFLCGRQQKQVADRQPRDEILLLSHERHVLRESVLRSPPFDILADRTIAHEHESCPHPAMNAAEYLERHVDALDGPEVRHVQDDRVAVAARAEPRTEIWIRAPPILAAIEEVRDDADVVLDAECADRVRLQALGDGGHTIGSLDAERDDPRVRRVAAHERDVGAVQGRDGSRRCDARGRGEHLARHVCGGGVWNGVMRVHDVEPPLLRDAHDRVGEREQILRFPEQRIRWNLDAFEGESGDPFAPAKWGLAADQADLVPPQRQRMRELGGDHAAPADRRVAHHPDVHGTCFSSPERCSGSRTTSPSANATPASAPNCASRLSTN